MEQERGKLLVKVLEAILAGQERVAEVSGDRDLWQINVDTRQALDDLVKAMEPAAPGRPGIIEYYERAARDAGLLGPEDRTDNPDEAPPSRDYGGTLRQ